MARKLRIQYEGAIYHVTLRGVDRRRIFMDDDDRRRFLTRLEEAVGEHGVRLYLFCLMENHVHLLVETPQGNLSQFMHKAQTAYSVYFNLRHRRSGHLLQGRFGAEPVEGDEYLGKLSRYIHLNPVCVGALKKQPPAVRRAHLRAYAWSSYRGYAGLERPRAWVAEGPVLALTGERKARRRRAYRAFVEAGLAETDEEFRDLLKSARWGIGGADFQARMRALHGEQARRTKRQEDVVFRRTEPRLDPDRILRTVGRAFQADPESLRKRRRDCPARAATALLLGRHAGLNQRDIGVWLGMGTGAAVSQQLQRFRDRCAREPELERRLRTAQESLAAPETTTVHETK